MKRLKRILLRVMLYIAIALVLLVLIAVTIGWLLSVSGYKGPVSDHFDGSSFINSTKRTHGFFGVLKWGFNRDTGEWPDWVDITPAPKPAERVEGMRLVVTFVNHSTFLIQTEGLNILTDPVWSKKVGPVSWLGKSRVKNPGIRFEDLPPIDLVLVTHNHYDHLDLPTLRMLYEKHSPRIVTTLGNESFLNKKGIKGAAEMDWWNSIEIAPGVILHCIPASHFSGRGTFDRQNTLWASFVIESGDSRALFAGDTGYTDVYREVNERLGQVRLAILPIGAYRPRWFMQPVHMNPHEAVQAHIDLQAAISLAAHFGTFQMADDGYDEPLIDLKKAIVELKPQGEFLALENGQSIEAPMSDPQPLP